MENEEWRVVPILRGEYEVSSFGNIRESSTKQPIKLTISTIGYPVFSVRGNLLSPPRPRNKRFPIYVHTCVALAFLQNLRNLNEVNHIDGDKTNNNVNNLEWCTHAENMKHAGKNGLCKGYGYKPVLQIKNGEVIAKFNSIASASRATGISQNAISNVINHRVTKAGGHYYRAGGFEWERSECT